MPPQKKGFAEEPSPFAAADAELKTVGHTLLKVDSAGRVVIPAEMRAAMLVKPGDTVTAQVIDGEFKIMSPDVVLKRIQAFAKDFRTKNPGVSVVDELISDRREEAQREDERYERLEREAAEIEKKRSDPK